MTEEITASIESLLSDLNIRLVTREDLLALEWEGEYSHFRRLFAEAFQRAQMGEAVLWVADLKNTGLIGQVFVHLNSQRQELADGIDRAYIYGFRVRAGYRNRGVGTQLLLAAEDDLKQRGFRWVSLNVGQDNPAARRLYERNGYYVIGTDPGYWFYIDERGIRREVHEPAFRMEKPLFR